MHRAKFRLLLAEKCGNKFRNIWHFICNACGYCIFVYSAPRATVMHIEMSDY